jgi:hypothetical protein
MCFLCHQMGHYASESSKKKGKAKQVSVGTIVGVDGDSS